MLPTAAEWRWLLPTLVFIGVTLVSARFAAADYALEAVRYVLRLLAAALFMLVGLRLGRDPRQARAVLWAIALGAGLSGLLGIGEALRWAPLGTVLELFKVAPTRVGGELRVSGSFQYATIAAMYFEMVAPLAIVLAATTRRRSAQVLAAGIAVVCTANVVLSLTRAGMLTLLAIYAVLLAVGCARRGLRRVVWPTLAGAVALAGGVALLFVHNPVFDLRLQTEGDADWYGAAYSAPASLSLQADGAAPVDIDVRNEGRITWTSSGNHPFALGYRWLTEDGSGVLDVTPAEVPLAHDVEPGETIHLQANVVVPDLPAGTYRLDWGMLQRDVLQFYERGWADAETQVSVAPGAAGGVMPAVSARDDEEAPWVVGRMALWGAAARLIAAHPLLGVGPDNFRHYYGEELGLEAWDERVQANNVYLEVLTDVGVLGLAAFALVVIGPLVGAARLALGTHPEAGAGRGAVAAGRSGAGVGPGDALAGSGATGAGRGAERPGATQASGPTGAGTAAAGAREASELPTWGAASDALGRQPPTARGGALQAGGAREVMEPPTARGGALQAGGAREVMEPPTARGGARQAGDALGPTEPPTARGGALQAGGAREVMEPPTARGEALQAGDAQRALELPIAPEWGNAPPTTNRLMGDGTAARVRRGWVEDVTGLRAYLALGVGCGIIAFLVHGLLDSFLVFNPTAWLFWLLLGFASVLAAGAHD